MGHVVTRIATILALVTVVGPLAACGGDGTSEVDASEIKAWCARMAECEPDEYDDSDLPECEVAIGALFASLEQVFGATCTNAAVALFQCESTAPCNEFNACPDLEQTAGEACSDLL